MYIYHESQGDPLSLSHCFFFPESDVLYKSNGGWPKILAIAL